MSKILLLLYLLAKTPSVMLVVDRSTPHPQQIIYLLQIVDFIGAAGRYVATTGPSTLL